MGVPAASEAVRFGKYSLVARLATGGMAEIFLARLQGAAGFEKLVCIKRILPHLARDKQFVAMFLDEARIAARITHANVCQVFELGEIEGSYYLAMEYLEGVPLSCFRRRDYRGGPPDPRLVAGIAVQACEGLHHAHQLKHAEGRPMELVHRDVSPQNLFATVDGIIKVLDFGIAKIQDATVRTSTGALKGTYAYMAPEQLRGERIDRRSDVFALGITMWETLTRRHLFKRETEFLTFQAITSDPIADVCALRPDVPAALSEVIKKSLSRERDARFATARQLGEAIASAVAPLGAPAIGEAIASAFPNQLAAQAELMRVARAGGSYALDIDRGPSVGQGSDASIPPDARPPSSRISSLGELPSHRADALHDDPHGYEASHDMAPTIVAAAPTIVAAARPRRSWQTRAITAAALVLGGLAIYVYLSSPHAPPEHVVEQDGKTVEPRSAPAAAPPGTRAAVPADPDKVAPQSGSAPSALPRSGSSPSALPQSQSSPSAVPPNASPQGISPGAAPPNAVPRRDPPQAAAPQNAAQPDSTQAPAPERPKPPARAPRPSGPPGFITIDTPFGEYATITIDGKDYGYTPLSKIELPPGRHVVHAVRSSGGARDYAIAIEPGKVAPTLRIQGK